MTRSFPYRCIDCGQVAVVATTINHTRTVLYMGHKRTLEMAGVPVHRCEKCGEMTFGTDSEDALHAAIRAAPWYRPDHPVPGATAMPGLGGAVVAIVCDRLGISRRQFYESRFPRAEEARALADQVLRRCGWSNYGIGWKVYGTSHTGPMMRERKWRQPHPLAGEVERLAKAAMADSEELKGPSMPVVAEEVVQEVCDRLAVLRSDVKSRKRYREIVRARQVATAAVYALGAFSLEDTVRLVGGATHHSTGVYALAQVRKVPEMRQLAAEVGEWARLRIIGGTATGPTNGPERGANDCDRPGVVGDQGRDARPHPAAAAG